jgi:hypothetical protein
MRIGAQQPLHYSLTSVSVMSPPVNFSRRQDGLQCALPFLKEHSVHASSCSCSKAMHQVAALPLRLIGKEVARPARFPSHHGRCILSSSSQSSRIPNMEFIHVLCGYCSTLSRSSHMLDPQPVARFVLTRPPSSQKTVEGPAR